MEWEITMLPVDESVAAWTWVASRKDGETVRYGFEQYTSSEAALAAAQAEADAFEANAGIVKDRTVTVTYTPTGVVLPDPPVEIP